MSCRVTSCPEHRVTPLHERRVTPGGLTRPTFGVGVGIGWRFGSEVIAEAPEFLADQLIQLRAPGHLLGQPGGEFLHLVGKGFVVIFDLFGTDVAAGGEYVAMLGDFGEGDAAAEAGDVGVGGQTFPLSADPSPARGEGRFE